jgi:hypothetical protein
MDTRTSTLALAMTGLLGAAVFAQQEQPPPIQQPPPLNQQASSSAGQPTADQATEQAIAADLRRRQPNLGASEAARIARGFRIAPVRLDMSQKDPLLVGLGSYLVNTGGCNDCHTTPNFAPGGDPFQGRPKQINAANYLAGGAPFGPFISRDLTPDPATGLPGGLTYAEFARTMRTGFDIKQLHPDVSPLLQVMPWPVYQDMIERDLRAMYEYLRAIPHAEPGTPAQP